MSIIYDSLKKIEKDRIPTQHPIPKTPPQEQKSGLLKHLRLIAFYGIFSVVGAAVSIFTFKSFFKNPGPSKKFIAAKSKPVGLPRDARQAPTSLKLVAPLILNGIFFSGKSGYALINNQIVTEGEVVEGAYVQRISEDGVVLKSSSGIMRLSTRAK
ncbi:MAG: hypothetical protein NT033_00690 [Candidatus Omnitrophica bacterium]|nr:hypothetical protein [Candidatus Omnitrophota bacterium]